MSDHEKLLKQHADMCSMARMEPLRVIAQICSPIASVLPWISLDGLLALAVIKDVLGADAQDMLGRPADQMIHVPLPLAVANKESEKWFWMASLGVYDYTESTVRFRKRWDEGHDDVVAFSPKRKPRVQYDGLHFKAKDMPIILRSTREITWYANGNIHELDRLLNTHITHIGKHGNAGYGRVERFTVEHVNIDLSCYINGQPSRPIPCDLEWIERDRRIEFCGYRPPYWAPQNQALCYMPV